MGFQGCFRFGGCPSYRNSVGQLGGVSCVGVAFPEQGRMAFLKLMLLQRQP